MKQKGHAMQDMLLVLNFDTRYASAIAMRLRLERIDCRIVPGDTSLESVTALAPLGLVLAGGVEGEMPTELDGRLLSAGIPVLAMGDASLSLCSLLGGSLEAPRAIHDVETLTLIPPAYPVSQETATLLQVAEAELDYQEGRDGSTKYGAWAARCSGWTIPSTPPTTPVGTGF